MAAIFCDFIKVNNSPKLMLAVMASANSILAQMPLIGNKLGKTMTPNATNTNPRAREIMVA
jgi:hypothetical protein